MNEQINNGPAGDGIWREIRELWGDQIRPVPDEFIGPQVSAATRAYLTSVGLPTATPRRLTFYRDERLSRPATADGRYIPFAEAAGVQLVIDAPTDEVYDLIPGKQTPRRFVNSNLPLFVLTLGLIQSYRPRLLDAADDEFDQLVDELREQLRARDAHAMADGANLWRVELSHVAEGQV